MILQTIFTETNRITCKSTLSADSISPESEKAIAQAEDVARKIIAAHTPHKPQETSENT